MSSPQLNHEKFLPMSVSNIGFLLDRLGQDCHPLQFLRELTQNSIEAILRTKGKGEIVWDMDWVSYELDGLKKLCIIDNGDGMTGEEMVRFINQLSSSMSTQSMSGNYGVGAKITAATKNHFGVVYLSWKQGEGSMIQMVRDSKTGQYGLKQWKLKDKSYSHSLPIGEDVKPKPIKDHGTKVVLLGNAEDENTMEGPATASSPSRWISKYLNSRYYKFPQNITVRAREGWQFPKEDKDRNILRTLTGQHAYLKQHSASSGRVELTDASAHWWILKEDNAIQNNSGFIESSGHIAALYQDELYEMSTARSGMSKLQQFGIVFGYKFVVIYVEPTSIKLLTTNTARTTILINNESLPWGEWANEFRTNLPAEIGKLIEEKAAAASNTDHSKTIRERLKDIINLFQISRYKPDNSGKSYIDEERLINAGISPTTEPGKIRNELKSSGIGGNVYAVFEKEEGLPAIKIKPDPFPQVKWVSVNNGTREQGDIEDRAAKYLSESNMLLINGDFTVFTDLVQYLYKELKAAVGIETAIVDAAREWYEQALVETVIGLQSLVNRKDWTPNDIDKALSEEALTAAVMQRYHIFKAVKKDVTSKVGSLKAITNRLLLMCA